MKKTHLRLAYVQCRVAFVTDNSLSTVRFKKKVFGSCGIMWHNDNCNLAISSFFFYIYSKFTMNS